MVGSTMTSDAGGPDLLRQHLPMVQQIARRLNRCYSWVDRDDLRGYASLGLALAARSFDPGRGIPFARYAATKATFLAVDEMRRDGLVQRDRRGRHPRMVPLQMDICDPGARDRRDRVEKRDLCEALLRKIRSEDRQLLLMYYADELTFREIAEVFSISESAVCLRHKALMRRLRRLTASSRRGLHVREGAGHDEH